MSKLEAVAVVGIGCVYPGAGNVDELWDNVLAGRRFFRRTPDERLPLRDYQDYDQAVVDKTYSDQMAVISDWDFDPVAHRIPPISFRASDLAHWLALDTAIAAVADIGLDVDCLDKSRVGVILGNSLAGEFCRSHNMRLRWPYVERVMRRVFARSGMSELKVGILLAAVKEAYNQPLPAASEDTLAGNMSNTIAGRICNHFDFGGGGFTIDGACSSSLLSVANACDALLNGDMDMALTGGVDMSLDPFEIVGFAKTKALATDDIRPYDERAAGMLTGEGCGVVVLMREGDARRQGLDIYALIKGWGYSSDGAGGITAPEVEGQARALRKAYERAGYPMSSVGLIEGHGTGTKLGDKVELAAILRVMADGSARDVKTPCRIGSIKGNIGHCKAAAGVAGLIKAAMALKRKILPPTMNCLRPNAVFADCADILSPSVYPRAWEAGVVPRRAAISAMGFGGSNSHVTLEEVDPGIEALESDLAKLASARNSELILFAAADAAEMKNRVSRVIPVAAKVSRAELTDLAAALTAELSGGDHRLALVADSPWRLRGQLDRVLSVLADGDIADCHDPVAGIFAGTVLSNPVFAALFPGQGSQRVNMARDYYQAFPFVRDLFDGSDFVGKLFRPPLPEESDLAAEWAEELKSTAVSQPAIVASSLAVLKTLEHFGLEPDICLGHSLGEICAVRAAGACDDAAAVAIATRRGWAIESLRLRDNGAMAAVAADIETVAGLVGETDGFITVANHNSPRQVVVSGDSAAVAEFAEVCDERGIRCRSLPVSHAFHSEIIAPAAAELEKAVAEIDIAAVDGRFVSSCLGGEGEDIDIRSLLAGQLVKPVKFVDAVIAVAAKEPSLWAELGPGAVLGGLVRSIAGGEVMPTDNGDGLDSLHRLLAAAFVQGFPVKTERLFEHRFHRRFDIDDYNPLFIVNPCERPLDESKLTVDLSGFGLDADFCPAGVDAADFTRYMSVRGDFVRDMIEVDYRHFNSGSAASVQVGPAVEASPAAPASAEDQSVIDYAIDWIVDRTGFPRSSVLPEMRLRDDLNLDSIKVGELIFMVCRKLGRQTPPDPSLFANIQLSDLISVAMSEFDKEPLADSSAPSKGGRSASGRAGAVPGIDDWVGSFQMERVRYPIERENKLILPRVGSVMIIAERDSVKAHALGKLFSAKGLSPAIADFESFNHHQGIDYSILVVLPPAAEPDFRVLSPDGFDVSLEFQAGKLFDIFRWIGAEREASWKNLRCVVARPDVEDSSFLDAGKAFLKTLSLEHSAAQFKWLCLPSSWDEDRWAEMVEREIGVTGDRVAFFYDLDGGRYIEAAYPVSAAAGDGARIAPGDVIVATGGAKGITFEMVRALALESGAKLALLGSSPGPSPDDDPAENEMSVHFRQLDGDNIEYRYWECDVTDLAAVRRTIAEVEDDLGRVRGILHGAGISQLKLLEEMDRGAFMRTIMIKARGLYNLLAVSPPESLEFLHVISSVLGKTGMRGQTDYTFANAWLDGAVEFLAKRHPGLHCLSLGYSVWSNAGLGVKLNVVDSLASSGIGTIPTGDGVGAYLDLVRGAHDLTTFTVNGRMGGAEMESRLFAPMPEFEGRFMDNVRRWIPGTELAVETTLSDRRDIFLREHVFEGTQVLPGVMIIEALSEAAAACVGSEEPPTVRNVKFNQPVIVPDGAELRVRILALADRDSGGARRVRVELRTEMDAFTTRNCEAECWFGVEPSVQSEFFVPGQDDAGDNPEDYSPHPLFQGKFFRRIQRIIKMEAEDESLTELRVPDGARYYSRGSQSTITPYPALRDAFLQSGLLVISPGSLPAEIGEIIFHAPAAPGAKLYCRTKVIERGADGEFKSNLTVFDESGGLVECLSGVVTRIPRGGGVKRDIRGVDPIAVRRAREDLLALLPDSPHSVAITSFEQIDSALTEGFLTGDERRDMAEKVSASRLDSALAGLISARRAAVDLARGRGVDEMDPLEISLSHDAAGKPGLEFAVDCEHGGLFAGLEVSIADGDGVSVAFIATAPVGVDFEAVEVRDAETWRALLNDDGYSLALDLTRDCGESFDRAATRVWTLLESAKKANGLRRLLPSFEASMGDPWLAFSLSVDGGRQEYLSALVRSASGGEAVMTISLLVGEAGTAAVDSAAEAELEFDRILDYIDDTMTGFMTRFKDDPDTPEVEANNAEFVQVVNNIMSRLIALEAMADETALYDFRARLLDELLKFLDGSDVFRHSIVKPYGYAGDFDLLNKLVEGNCDSVGIAYHFDRSQQEYPASVACRNRIEWVGSDLVAMVRGRPDKSVRILDIGCGAAPIERYLARHVPDVKLDLTAVDIEPACLEFVKNALSGGERKIEVLRLDLRLDETAAKLRELAKDVDFCIVVGIIEALRDEEVVRVFEALLAGLPADTPLYTESFLPDHPGRPYMEWFMDFHLGYREPEEVVELLVRAGVDKNRMIQSTDATNSLGFLKLRT